MSLSFYIWIVFCFCLNFETILTQSICSCPDSNDYNFIELGYILESTPKNAVLKLLFFEGGDQIEVWGEDNNSYIIFNNKTKEVKTKKKLKVTKTSLMFIDFSLTCSVKNSDQTVNYTIILTIEDENDHPPLFKSEYFIYNISELTPQGISLSPIISVLDEDPRDQSKLTFSIISDSQYSDYFNFSTPSIGRLFLVKELIGIPQTQISFQIQVKDNSYGYKVLNKSQPQHVTNCSVFINVVPLLGDLPQNINTSYTHFLPLNFKKGDEIIVDRRWVFENGSLVFKIINDSLNDDWKWFSINHTSGVVRVEKEPQYKNQYLIMMRVNKFSKSLFATFLLILKRRFFLNFSKSSYSFSFPFNTPLDIPVFNVELLGDKKSGLICEETMKLQLEGHYGEVFQINNNADLILKKHPLQNKFNFKLVLTNIITNVKEFAKVKVKVTGITNNSIENENSTHYDFTHEIYEFVPYNNNYIGRVEINSLTNLNVNYRVVSKNKNIKINKKGILSCQEEYCGLKNVVMVIGESHNKIISTLVYIHEFEPLNTVTKAQTFSKSLVNYKTAFIISLILALLFFIIIITLITIFYVLSKKLSSIRSLEQTDPLPNTTLHSINSNQPLTQKKVLGLEHLYQTLKFKKNAKKATSEINSEPQSASQKHHNEDLSSELNLPRSDSNTSQETINISVMTLTRPEVGTNGITVYY